MGRGTGGRCLPGLPSGANLPCRGATRKRLFRNASGLLDRGPRRAGRVRSRGRRGCSGCVGRARAAGRTTCFDGGVDRAPVGGSKRRDRNLTAAGEPQRCSYSAGVRACEWFVCARTLTRRTQTTMGHRIAWLTFKLHRLVCLSETSSGGWRWRLRVVGGRSLRATRPILDRDEI